MKLYEEFKEYENLWKTRKPLKEESEFSKLISTPKGREKLDTLPYEEFSKLVKADDDEINKIINEYDYFEFDYDGFVCEWCEDHFDPGLAWGHYQTEHEAEHEAYTYCVDAVNIFELLADNLIMKNADKHADNGYVQEYIKLNKVSEKAWEAVYKAGFNTVRHKEIDMADAALERFLATNLDYFVDIFYDELTEYYADEAREWAESNW